MLVSSIAVAIGLAGANTGDTWTAVPPKSGAPMWKGLRGLMWDLLPFSRPLSSIHTLGMLIGGHRFADAGIDAMGCSREQDFPRAI